VNAPHPQKQTAAKTTNSPSTDVEREIRFAVVMYGGVSLAIYINGVTQELLHMVRATARASGPAKMLFSPEELSASEKVYRQIAKLLDEQSGMKDGPPDLTQTRFIVDVISGTSAGGINGVFLAKALARNQTMNGLKSLWLTEGDLGKLLNDTKAEDYSTELGFAVQKPEKSLLNSQRMYRKLLQALAEMNQKTPAEEIKAEEEEASPLVKELDLFVTTTDIEGIPLPIQLADGVVYERRYRNVFHFRYASEAVTQSKRDDFMRKNDPFLAFAARCTSSFPFAFDAMQLDDIETILGRYPRYQDDDAAGGKQWDVFLKDYLRLGLIDIDRKARGGDALGLEGSADAATARLRKAFRDRSFGDGGYLDNKPFSYATSMLMRRSSDCVVDRKLLYVEPTPEHPELAPREPGPRPDFAENIRAAAMDLPRQETIREDIERVYERNEILQRVGNFAKYLDEDAIGIDLPPSIDDPADYAKKDLREMMQHGYGAAYGSYHRLKVHEITELLTCLVTRAVGHDAGSNAGDAIRELVTMWRNDKYKLLRPLEKRPHGKGDQETENQFLLDYDIQYRFRRLSFLSRRINQLAGIGQGGELGSTARNLLLAWLSRAGKVISSPNPSQKGKAAPVLDPEKLTALQEWLKASEKSGSVKATDEIPDANQWLNDFRHELSAIKKAIAEPTQKARYTEEQFLHPNNPALEKFQKSIAQLKLPWKDIEPLLSKNTTEKADAIAKLLGDGVMAQLDSVADELRKVFDNKSFSGLTIARASDKDPTKGAEAARMCLGHYYRNFLLYDLITYPIQYGTGAGEANVVQIYRVSPEDAPKIMQEKAGAPREKLAGRTLMSFGAFLDESWRRNDMLWGRLDGAERLISTFLPLPDEIKESDGETTERKALREEIKEKHQQRSDLIYQVHHGILREEVLDGNANAVCRLLSNALAHSDGSSNKHLEAIVAALWEKDLAPYMTEARREYLVAPRKFDRHLDAETALKYISRSTNITGNMLSGLADKYHSDPGKRVSGWIARLGTAFWSMVAVAVPQSLGSIFFKHWLGLLYLFSAIVILAGIFFNSARSIGWQLLAVTVSLNLVTLFLGDFMAGGKRLLRALRRSLILVVAALIGFGTYFVASHSLDFFANYRVQSGIVAGSAVLILLGLAEWWRWSRRFLSAPTTSFNYRLLIGLTLATALVAGLLAVIGPVDMAGVEFSRTQTIADKFRDFAGVDRLRIQLGVDFALIAAYAAMLASYCVAGAKLLWQRRENLDYKFQLKRKAALTSAQTSENSGDQKTPDLKPPLRLKFFCALVIVGFFVAGLQWLAGLADVSENVGLLLYLKEKPPTEFDPLKIAYWSATVKFSLIALGAIYAALALTFGAAKKLGDRPVARKPDEIFKRVIFVLVSLTYIWFSWHGLFVCRPEPCKNCPPSLLSIFTTAKKFPATPSQSCD
jgi:patatin-related protein